MSNIKMSDAFIMPVKRVEGGVLPMLYDNQNGLIFVANHEYVDAAAVAINSHDRLTEQNKMLLLDVSTLKKAIGSAVVAIENESDMDKASSLLTRALANTEDFK